MMRVVETETHPIIEKHGSFEHVRLGRGPVREDPRTFRFARYLDDAVALPAIPKTHATPLIPVWQMYGNDRLGDCTIAAAGHMIMAWTKEAGHPVVPPPQRIERAYWLTGTPSRIVGVPNGPTDNGRVCLDVLNFWRKTGIGPNRITAYVSIDPTNHAQMKAAIHLFGGVYVGMALPKSAQTQTKWAVTTGKDAKAGSWGGHAVPFVGYTATTLTCVTWGHTMGLSFGFNDAYTEEAYAIVSSDYLTAAGKSPQGFDMTALLADLGAL
jgi:hypothetical protein